MQLDEFTGNLLETLWRWVTTPWLQIGETDLHLARLIGLALILFFAWWFSSLLEHGLRNVAARSKGTHMNSSGMYALTRIIRYAVWIIGTLVGLRYLGLDLTNIALVGGAIGVGIGLGLQNIFSNFISGLILLLEKTLKVGDFVDLQSGVMGRVTEIGMRYTRITTNDLVDIIVPNSEFVTGRVTNWSFDEKFRRIHVPFGVAYGSDKHRVKAAVLKAVEAVPGCITSLPGRQPDVWLTRFGDSSLDFELVVWVEHDLMISPGATHARFMWAIDDQLRLAGVEIPFPQRDLHLRSGSLRLDLGEGQRLQVSAAPPRDDESGPG
ncbi:mechanosensitive ion channel family protein [Pseudomonas sp. MBLB4123]|uniref:mechanosensitive ion channel family protein n=1 Tax=Pseudomonas sp. MBLB4123 TaxID=3451557 RepID=UPI003F754FBB